MLADCNAIIVFMRRNHLALFLLLDIVITFNAIIDPVNKKSGNNLLCYSAVDNQIMLV
jgi:hypothetical protein